MNLIQKSALLIGKKFFELELKTWRLDKTNPNSTKLKQRPDIIETVLDGYSDLMQHFLESNLEPGSLGQAQEAERLVRRIQKKIRTLDGLDDNYMADAFCGSIIRRAIDHTKRVTGKRYAVY